MLLSLVNDMLDMKLIQHNKFTPKKDHFNPVEVLNFITAMFQLEADMMKTSLSYQIVKA
jgi:hypothetical protein